MYQCHKHLSSAAHPPSPLAITECHDPQSADFAKQKHAVHHAAIQAIQKSQGKM
jgi:hypothetical protein